MKKIRRTDIRKVNTCFKVLGLDCSSSTVGWGLLGFIKQPVLMSYGHIKPLNSQFDIFVRLEDLYQQIGHLCMDLEPDYIAIEDIVLHMQGKSSAKTITTLAIFNRVAGLSVYTHTGVIPKLLPVGTIRKYLRMAHSDIDSKYKKEDIPNIIRTYLDSDFTNIINKNQNISKETYDEADGIAAAWAYTLQLGGKCG